MENYEKYFEKNGFIYGVSSKYNFGHWDHRVCKFTDLEKAKKWLRTEEYDFRERELCSKAKAISYAGKKTVEAAVETA